MESSNHPIQLHTNSGIKVIYFFFIIIITNYEIDSKFSTDTAQEIMFSLGAFVTNSKARCLKIRIRLNLDQSVKGPVKPDEQDY